jgi:small subunit ribosomal protein S13
MICLIISKNLLKNKNIPLGCGKSSISKIMYILGFALNQNFKNLSKQDIADISIIAGRVVRDANINDIKKHNIKNKVDINTFAGRRHRSYMPVRGQKTRTNASTRKRFHII